MTVSYFPGCTLRTKAKQLDFYARRSAQALGISLEEIENWQCCGGAFTSARDEVATKLAAVRALAAAKEKNQILVSVCSACHNVLKQTEHQIETDAEFSDRANRYLAPDITYTGGTKVVHYLELLRDIVGFDNVRKAVKNPLTGRRIGTYYGCLLLRPAGIMQMDDAENPRILEDFLRALGAEPVIYARRNDCCGGYITAEDPAQAEKNSAKILKNAADAGAEMLLTACPLCRYNLEKNSGTQLPVLYFTELLAEALGVKEDA